jgi:calmodulin
MAHELSPEQMGVLKEVFALFDKDGDGNISPEDLNGMLEMLGQHVTRDEVSAMFQEADIDANGVIDISDFAALYAMKINSAEETENDLIETFKFYDVNSTGYITTSNLMYAMERLGCKLTPAEAEEMIREADLDGDGRMDYRDFRRVMMAPQDEHGKRAGATKAR